MPRDRFSASHRLQQVQDPIIPIVADMISHNPGTISLGQGVVNYPPPKSVMHKTRQFGRELDKHLYSEVGGTRELRQTIKSKLSQENNIIVNDIDQIMVTAGSNMAFLNAIMAISEPGDEIILLRPFYFNHDMAISMLGCNTIAVDCDENYQPDLAALRQAISNRTRAIVTVSPNNPTGAVYDESILRDINTLCLDKGLFHITDEAYEYFTYDGSEHFSPASISGSEDHTISLF